MTISSPPTMGDYSKLPSIAADNGATSTATAYDRVMSGIETTGFVAVFGYLFVRNLIKPIPWIHSAQYFPIWILFQNSVIYHGLRRLIYRRFETRREEMSYGDLKLAYKSLILSIAFATLFMLAGHAFGCYGNYPCSTSEWDRDIVIVLAFFVGIHLATGLTQLLVVCPEGIVRDEVEEYSRRVLENV
ncbi:hypothetical protein LINGRAHAP2_LOCUS22016 [Linum grandiflorum]